MLPVLIFTAFLILIIWAVIVRPQLQEQKRYREDRQALADSLVPGVRVESFSGIHGTIVSVAEDTVEMEIADGVVVTMSRLAVSSKIDGGADDGQDGLVQQVSNPEPDRASTDADGDLS